MWHCKYCCAGLKTSSKMQHWSSFCMMFQVMIAGICFLDSDAPHKDSFSAGLVADFIKFRALNLRMVISMRTAVNISSGWLARSWMRAEAICLRILPLKSWWRWHTNIGGMFCKNFRLQRVGTKNGDADKECFNKGSTSLYINTKPSRLTLAAIPD